MDNFQIWKLATDAALVLSILVLCVRFMRSQAPAVNMREMRDLEIVLKNLLKDADVSSRSLGESLTRRQQGLERLLSELEGGERRISVLIQSADDARGRLEKAPRPQARFEAPEVDRREEPSSGVISRAAAALEKEEYFASRTEPASFENSTHVIPQRSAKRQPEKSEPLELEVEASPRRTGAAAYKSAAIRHEASARKNIYGEMIGESESEPSSTVINRSRISRPALSQEIEIERSGREASKAEANRSFERAAAPSQNIEDDVEQIYEAAEKLLTAGESMDAVASVTQLPLDEVRKLSRIVASARRAREASEAEDAMITKSTASNSNISTTSNDPTADPRLGVFATIRRQTQVL